MPIVVVDGCPIHVEVEGPQNAAVLMLSNSLGTDLHMWDDQMPAFLTHFRVVRYDRRGHGRSGVSKGPYSMEMLGRDVLAIHSRRVPLASDVDLEELAGATLGFSGADIAPRLLRPTSLVHPLA